MLHELLVLVLLLEVESQKLVGQRRQTALRIKTQEVHGQFGLFLQVFGLIDRRPGIELLLGLGLPHDPDGFGRSHQGFVFVQEEPFVFLSRLLVLLSRVLSGGPVPGGKQTQESDCGEYLFHSFSPRSHEKKAVPIRRLDSHCGIKGQRIHGRGGVRGTPWGCPGDSLLRFFRPQSFDQFGGFFPGPLQISFQDQDLPEAFPGLGHGSLGGQDAAHADE